MNIKVLGEGCNKCETLLKNVNTALAESGKEAEVEYITDFAVIAGYGIMSTPALMINNKVIASGKVLKPKEIQNYL